MLPECFSALRGCSCWQAGVVEAESPGQLERSITWPSFPTKSGTELTAAQVLRQGNRGACRGKSTERYKRAPCRSPAKPQLRGGLGEPRKPINQASPQHLREGRGKVPDARCASGEFLDFGSCSTMKCTKQD